MLGKNHIVSSCSSWVLLQPYILNNNPSVLEQCLLIGVVGVGAILCDIDHPQSILGRRVKFISVPLSFFQGDARLLPWSESTHSRGITHSIWMLLGCWWIFQETNNFGIAMAFGIVAHLIEDALTLAGLNSVFWPIQYKIRSPLAFSTGGIFEYVLTYTLVSFAVSSLLGFDLIEHIRLIMGN